MAMSGSAIGLGNIWRFPYMLGENGGGAFLIIYILCCILVSLPIFCCESIIGKRARQSAYGAIKCLAPGSKWKVVGMIPIITAFIVSSFYSVVGGWSIDYLVRSCTGKLYAGTSVEAAALFDGLSSGVAEPLFFFFVFLGITAYVVHRGVKAGIEGFSKIATPALGILIIMVAVYSICLPGAEKGVIYLFQPDWSGVTAATVANAMGQSFFSMSLGSGVVLVFSSFMKKDDNILVSGTTTAFFDTLFAIIAALAVMPAVFSAGLQPTAGPSLVFETLPLIFTQMSAEVPMLGNSITIVFFITIVIAALTSSVSMFEVGVEQLVDHFGLRRRYATLLFLLASFALGVFCCLSFGVFSGIRIFNHNIFSLCDFVSANVLMTGTALLICIFVGWKMNKEDVRDEITNGASLKRVNSIFEPLYFLIKWVIPAMIIVVMATSLLA